MITNPNEVTALMATGAALVYDADNEDFMISGQAVDPTLIDFMEDSRLIARDGWNHGPAIAGAQLKFILLPVR